MHPPAAATHATLGVMQIFVRKQDGGVLTIEVEGDHTVDELKAMVSQQSGTPVADLRLHFPRHQVVVEELNAADRPLREYGVQKESELRMAVVPAGGAGGTLSRARKATDSRFDSVSEMRDLFATAHRDLDDAKARLAERKAALIRRNKDKKLKDKLKLNVSGHALTTSRAVLSLFPRTNLAALASGCYDSELLRDKRGRIFLDLDVDCFRDIIDFLTAYRDSGFAFHRPSLPDGPAGSEATMAQLLATFGITAAVEAAAAAAAGEDDAAAGGGGGPHEGQPPVRLAPDAAGDVEPEPEPECERPAWEQLGIEDRLSQLQASLLSERKELQRAFREHDEFLAEFEAEQQWISRFTKCSGDDPAAVAGASELVVLKVGSASITTRRSTLTLCPESVLAQRFGGAVAAAGADDTSDSDSDSDEEGLAIDGDRFALRLLIGQLQLRAIAEPGEPIPPISLAAIPASKREAFDSTLAMYFPGETSAFVLGEACDTAILSAEQLEHVLGWLERPEPPRLELIYRASRDGWADTDFHRMCAGKPSTVSVIRSVGGYIFGGYLQPAWKPEAQGRLASETKGIAPASAFVFALHSHSGLGPTKIPYTGQSYAAANSSDGCCMAFGNGYHIVVKSNANANENSYTSFTNSAYACPAGQDGARFLVGAQNFRAAEVEVFQVSQ